MRNKITFHHIPSYQICNPDISNILVKFADFYHPDLSITIHITNLDDIGIVFSGIIPDGLLEIIKYLPNIKYLQFNDDIKIDEMMKEKISDNIITRTFHTFHQNDDIIRMGIHQLFSTVHYSKVLFIGGECYLYPYLVKPDKYEIYTDSYDIYMTAQANHKTTVSYLVNYHNCHIGDLDYDACILNTSIKGLTLHLNQIINNSGIPIIYIVSCSEKSFLKDYKLLTNYNLENQTKFENHGFTVFVNLLFKK